MKYIIALLILIAELSGALAQATGPAAENALITKATAALTARHWQEAENLLKQLVAMAPNRADYQRSLGDAQGNLGRFREAVGSYDKAIALAEKNPASAENKAVLATAFTGKGNMLLKLKDQKAAIAAFEKAAPLSANPGVAYFNICATLYNIGEIRSALASCDKAIAADPKKADAYFIKGSVLVGEGTMNKSGKIVVPAAAIQALRKYLELAPNGGHVSDVKQMLDALVGG